MAKFKGTLNIEDGESRLKGTLLALEGEEDPLGAATDFLANQNLFDDDAAEITGEKGPLGTETVIFMTDAQPLEEEVEAAIVDGLEAFVAVAGVSGTKVGTKARKKSEKKRSSKKPAAKKAGRKRPAKKAGKKRTAKKGGKKRPAKSRTRKSPARKSATNSRRKK